MAIATLDATSTFSDTDNNSSFGGNYTVSAGTNTILIAQIVGYGNGGSARSVSTLTYNSADMTKAVNKTYDTGSGSFHFAEIWYRVNPDTGTNALAGTMNLNTDGIYWALSTYSGVAQTGQPDATASEADTSGNDPSPHEQSITVVADNSWIWDATLSWGITSPAVSAGQTENWAATGSYKAATSAGAYTMGWTYSGSGSFSHAIASFSPYVAPTTSIQTINGLAQASVKTVNGLAIASVKTVNGLA